MLLRGSQSRGGFVVPVVVHPKESDHPKRWPGRLTNDVVRERDAADARVSVVLESSRSRARLLGKLQDANEQGATGAGFARRFAMELKQDREARLGRAANSQALGALRTQSDQLDSEFQFRALKAEAGGRARDRIAQIGRMIDEFVSATKANPSGFEAHYDAALEGLEGLRLPKKVIAAFRERLSEIPRAALQVLAEEQPATAVDLVDRRQGPAHPRFGLKADVVRMLGKFACSKLEASDRARAAADDAQSTRAAIDIDSAIAAYKRGERDTLSLSGLESVGRAHRRSLRDKAKEARAERRRRDASVIATRERLAAGKAMDPDDPSDVDALDAYFDHAVRVRGGGAELGERDVALAAAAGVLPKSLARKIAVLVQSEDVSEAGAGARLIEELEKVDARLTKRLDPHVLRDAHDVIELAQAGVDWGEAVRLARQGTETAASERGRRAKAFTENAGGAAIVDAISKALGAEIAAVNDAA